MEIFQCSWLVAKVAVNASAIVERFGVEVFSAVVVDYIEYQAVGCVNDIGFVGCLDGEEVEIVPVRFGKAVGVDAVQKRQSLMRLVVCKCGDFGQAGVVRCFRAGAKERDN